MIDATKTFDGFADACKLWNEAIANLAKMLEQNADALPVFLKLREDIDSSPADLALRRLEVQAGDLMENAKRMRRIIQRGRQQAKST